MQLLFLLDQPRVQLPRALLCCAALRDQVFELVHLRRALLLAGKRMGNEEVVKAASQDTVSHLMAGQAQLLLRGARELRESLQLRKVPVKGINCCK